MFRPSVASLSQVAESLRFHIVRFAILGVTGALLVFGVLGTLKIPVEFDAVLLLPADSYLREGEHTFAFNLEASVAVGYTLDSGTSNNNSGPYRVYD